MRRCFWFSRMRSFWVNNGDDFKNERIL